MAEIPVDKPPFILGQGMRLLTEIEHPRKYLAAQYFRAGRQSADGRSRLGGNDRQQEPDVWVNVDRSDVAFDRVKIKGQSVSVHRMVIVTDAGIGKTTNLSWIHRQLCSDDSDKLAFQLPMSDLVPAGSTGSKWDVLVKEKLLSLLNQDLGEKAGSLSDSATAMIFFDRLLAAGRIVILLDGLDQMPVNSPALPALQFLLHHKAWSACRL